MILLARSTRRFLSIHGALPLLLGVLGLSTSATAQQTYIKASNADVQDAFGNAASLSGDTLVVASTREAGGSATDPSDNSVPGSGAVYVFVRDGGTWSEQAYIKDPALPFSSRFGTAVSLSGDTLAVSNAAQVVNIFTRTGTTWTLQDSLLGDLFSDDLFGYSLDLSGDTLVVGAPGENSNATGVDGDESNEDSSAAGAAFVYVRTGTTWTRQAYLKASNTDPGDEFGKAVAIDGDRIVIGAEGEDSNSNQINGDETDNSTPLAGAVYVFQRSGTTWSQEAYLKPIEPDPFDGFGISVDIRGDRVLVGSPGEESDGSGPSDNSLLQAGAAHVFDFNGTDWERTSFLKSPSPIRRGWFGQSVALSEDRIVVGSWRETSLAEGVNGDMFNQDGGTQGAAFVFEQSGAQWLHAAYLKPLSNVSNFAWFGWPVVADGNLIGVCARGDASGATGINGDPANLDAPASGAAYVFDASELEFPKLCFGDGGDQLGCTNCPCANNATPGSRTGCLNSQGSGASVRATGSPSVSFLPGATVDLRLSLTGAPGNALCVLTSGAAVAPQSMANPCFGAQSGVQSSDFDGLRCAVSGTRRHGARVSDLVGVVGTETSPWGGEGPPNLGLALAFGGFTSGETRFFQVIYRDDPRRVCARGLNSSDATQVIFVP